MNASLEEEIVRLTQEYGGNWGINHTRRLLELIATIGAGLDYDAEVIWLAAHLHDWGGYGPWVQSGIDHVVRSGQVARDYLVEHSFPQSVIEPVLECIAFHHSAGSDRSIEAILLRDADALDFLGVVGVLRDFAKQPKDLRKAYETVCRRKEQPRQIITLAKAREIAKKRIVEMEGLLSAFESETFGYF